MREVQIISGFEGELKMKRLGRCLYLIQEPKEKK